jgi:hypothetical protein
MPLTVPGMMTSAKASAVIAANSAITLPPRAYLIGIVIENTTANAVTGGIKIGTTAGGVDVAAAIAVGANALVTVSDAAILKRAFSASAAQQIFIDAVTLFNSASLNVTILYSWF